MVPNEKKPRKRPKPRKRTNPGWHSGIPSTLLTILSPYPTYNKNSICCPNQLYFTRISLFSNALLNKFLFKRCPEMGVWDEPHSVWRSGALYEEFDMMTLGLLHFCRPLEIVRGGEDLSRDFICGYRTHRVSLFLITFFGVFFRYQFPLVWSPVSPAY